MKPTQLVLRGLAYYWRTNIAVVVGVSTAVTVLAGALLVGDSVRGSLRDLVLQRLGRTDFALVSSDFFRQQLADDLRSDPLFDASFRDACPIIAVQGLATDQGSGRRSLGVQVYGVDDRFSRFHRFTGGSDDNFSGLGDRDVLLSPALAREIGAAVGGTVLLRIQRPSDIPLDSMHGQKDDPGRTLRLTLRKVLTSAELGEFSLQSQQGEVRAAFVPLSRLQQDLDLRDRVNVILVASADAATEAVRLKPDTTTVVPDPTAGPKPDTTGVRPDITTVPQAPGPAGDSSTALETLVRRNTAIEDLGLQLRPLEPQGVLSLEASGTLINAARADAAVATAAAFGMRTTPVFTYLADSIAIAGRPSSTAGSQVDRNSTTGIPYSLVTAIELGAIAPGLKSTASGSPPIVLNNWAARDLQSKIGDLITLDYRVWEDPGELRARSATFHLVGIVPIAGKAADRDLVPVFPGLTESNTLRDWDPPFPIDLRRIRQADEDYWRTYRTTPKAFIPLEVGQSLWQSRHGALTSIRIEPLAPAPLGEVRLQYVSRLRERLDPLALGLSIHNVRAEGLAASRGATDFGEYFTYFSFFLVASAVVLAALFFKLGVEQRGREVGLLRAVGFTPAAVRRLFMSEALVLSVAGSLLGVFGAVGYGYLMMAGLRTWWVDAVGTTALTLHVLPASLAAGCFGGVLAAIGSIWWTLRSLKRVSERSLLAGNVTVYSGPRTVADRTGSGISDSTKARLAAVTLFAVGLGLIVVGFSDWIGKTGAFFGAGAALLAACLFGLAASLGSPGSVRLSGHGWWPLTRLGIRNSSYRPGRSVLSVAVMASATFVLISVGAFRKDDNQRPADIHSGTGGYALLVNTLLPIVHDPDSAEGRELLGLSDLEDIAVTPFRVRPGDDASCLNLYEPRQPRIVAAPPGFIAAGRFSFQDSVADSEESRTNPWRLLEGQLEGGAIPVIGDANSMTYVLHKSLGDEIVIAAGSGPIRLRLVAALADSLFQGELLMSEANFLKFFPEQPGYQFLLVDAPVGQPVDKITAVLEDRLSDFGADAMPAAQRLAEFHKVENTYLSTFQTLGGLGLLLGTIGLAAVLLRNVLERRRELALLGAVGYRRGHIFTIVMSETAFLLVTGLAIGAACALVAIAPAAAERGGRLPAGAEVWLLLLAILVTGLLSSVVATRATLRTRLLGALKAE